MKWIVASAVFAAMPYWVSSAFAGVDREEVKVQAKVVVVVDQEDGGGKKARTHATFVTSGDAAEGDCNFVWIAGEGDGDGDGVAHTYTFKTGDGGDGCVGAAHVVKLVSEGAGGDGAWLGISMGPVPDAVHAQTGTKGAGVMILNVVEESPADAAGLMSHDIILSIDGESAEGKVGKLARIIGGHKPGDQVEILVLRDNKERSVTASLGSRKGLTGFDWKFELPPLAELDERVMVRGKFLRKGNDGEWEIRDLGNLEEIMEGLPDRIRMLLPKSGNRTLQFSLDGDHKTIKTVIKRDDTTLAITQEDGGEIVVTRTDADGTETVTTYADADELRADDEEAHNAFRHSEHVKVIDLDVDGVHALHDLHFDFDMDFGDIDFDELHEGMEDWRVHMEEAMGEAGGQYEEAMEKLHEALANLHDGPGGMLALPSLPPHMLLFRGEDDKSGNRVLRRFTQKKARQSFELMADGKIEVRVRKGDSELLQVFESEADLASRDPSLYDKYRGLIDAQD